MAMQCQMEIAAMVRTEPVSLPPRDAHSVPFASSPPRATRKEETTMVQKVASIALAFGLLAACALAQNTELQAGTVQGLVFTSEQDGGRLVVPGAKISLDVPSHLETESNNEGKFAINAVPSGAYTVTEHAPGLSATQTTVVSASAVSELALGMKLQAVTASTTLTASAE